MNIRPVYYKGHLITPFDNRVIVMVPTAKVVKDKDTNKGLCIMPHGDDETKVLKNLGYDVRPPVHMAYSFPAPPGQEAFEAQKVTTALITTSDRSFVLNGLGTGKTRAALFAHDYLSKQNKAPALIVSPLSTIKQTWGREVFDVFPHMKVAYLHGSKDKRLKELNSGADVFVINHDGVKVILNELVEFVKNTTLLVLDELSVYKNSSTALWKATNQLVKAAPRVVGMTATPMPRDALDAYGQIKLLTPLALRGMSKGRFREEMMRQITQYKWINKQDALEKVHKMMQPSVRFTRDECYDIPACQYIDLQAEASAEVTKFTKQMIEAGASMEFGVTAASVADVANKCLQAALGVVYGEDRAEIALDVTDRLEKLLQVVDSSEAKVLVFTPYKSSLRMLKEYLSKYYTVASISGDVGVSERETIFTNFRNSKDPHVLVAHPRTMSHGLTLTQASTVVWYGPPTSLEVYEQANGRITRAGQTRKQLVVNMYSTKREQRIFEVLRKRGDVQKLLLEMFENQEIESLK